LRGFLGIKSSRSKSKNSEAKWEKSVPPGSGSAAGYLRSVVKVSFGRVECREFARTVGDNEVVGPIPLSLDWEVLSVMVASVDQYDDFRAPVRKSRKEDFLYPLLKNGLLCWKEWRSDLPTVPVRAYQATQEEEWLIPREMARTWPAASGLGSTTESQALRSHVVGNHTAHFSESARQNMINLMKKLRVTLKRTGNVVGPQDDA
jgi:hypothetical protein